MAAPSVVSGFRRAVRLRRLVAAVWLVSIVIFVPVQEVVQAATGPARADLPAAGLGASEDIVVFVEIMRPLVLPIAVTLSCSWLIFVAWWILWHAATVRWWLDPETAAVRLAGFIGDGLSVWWRFARLALIAFVLEAVAFVIPWLPRRFDLEAKTALTALILAVAVTVVGSALVWLATLRGGWLLGEPDRRSALAAWARGLWAVLRQPLRSVLPMFVWALPGLALLVGPILIDGPATVFVLLVAWLGSAFCWVALHLSYAPPKPAAKRPVSPLVPPGPFVTTRFPTLHDNR